MKLALSVGLLAGVLAACGAAAPTPMQQADVVQFQGQQDLCTTENDARAVDDACRDRAKSFWCGDGGALANANACASVRLSDGGLP